MTDEDVGGWRDWLAGRDDRDRPANLTCLRCDGMQVIKKDVEGESFWCEECGLGWWYEWEDRVTVFQMEDGRLECVPDAMWLSPCLVVVAETEE